MKLIELRLAIDDSAKPQDVLHAITRMDDVLGACQLGNTGFGHLVADPKTVQSAVMAVSREDRDQAASVVAALLGAS